MLSYVPIGARGVRAAVREPRRTLVPLPEVRLSVVGASDAVTLLEARERL
jgi:hypothetical protein